MEQFPPPRRRQDTECSCSQTEDDTRAPSGEYRTNINGHPVLVRIIPEGDVPRTLTYYDSQRSLRLGIAHIVIGVTSIFFNILGLAVHHSLETYGFTMFYIAYGIWPAFFYIFSGGLSIAAARLRTNSTVVANLVMAIVAALNALAGHTTCAAIGFLEEFYEMSSFKAKIIMHGFLLSMAIAATVVSVWTVIICCSVLCCDKREQIEISVMESTSEQLERNPPSLSEGNSDMIELATHRDHISAQRSLAYVIPMSAMDDESPPPYCENYILPR